MALSPEEQARYDALRLKQLQAKKAAAVAKVAPAETEKPTPQRKPSGDAWHEDLGQGLAESGIRTYLGIKDLFGKASDAEKQSLADLSADASESGWGTAGNVVGEVAQLAVPGGAGVKAAKALSAANAASKAARALPLATDLIASAAHGAVRLPQEGDSRMQNALESGSGALGGAVLGKSLSLLGKGVKISPEAQRLRDMGVEVTPGQSVPYLKRAEDIAEVTPFLARAVKKLRNESQETAHVAALKQAVPPGKTVTKTGHQGVKELKNAYDEAYTAAWGSMDNLAPDAVPKALTVGSYGAKGLGKKDTATVRRVQDDVIKLLQGDPNVNGKKLDEVIRKARGGTKKTRDLDEVLTSMRDTLRSGLPQESNAALAAIDKQYPKYLVVKKAAETMGAMADKGHFDAAELLTGVKSVGRSLAGTGDAPMQNFANDVLATVGQKPGPQPLSWWRRMSDITPTLGPQKTLAKAVTGQAKSQKMLRRALESEAGKKARRLGYVVSPARLGAAYEQDEEKENEN